MALQTNSLVYSPAVRISVACRSLKGEIVDLSDDLTSGSLTLNEGAPHQLSFSLANQNGKYSSIFTPNDRVTVQMKRLQWVTVFSGYLTNVPYFSLYPQAVSLTAQCTLKKLLYQQWDPSYMNNLNWMQDLIQGAYVKNNNSIPTDAGMGAVLNGVVTQVGGWAQDRVHIGGIPPLWFQNLQPVFQSVQNEISSLNAQQAAAAATSSFYTSGSGTTGGSATSTTSGANGQGDSGPTWNGNSPPADGGANLPASTGQATNYTLSGSGIVTLSEGIPLDVDPYWSAVPWPYYGLDGNTGSGASETSAINYLKGPTGKGLPLLVTNQDNNKQVVVRAADFELARYVGYPKRLIDLSPTAFSDISGSGTTSEGVLNVQVQFCSDPNQAVGAVTTPVKVSPNHITTPVSGPANQTSPQGVSGPNARTAAHAGSARGSSAAAAQSAVDVVAQATGGAAAATVALQQVGVPYAWGGRTPAGFDCSGLVYYAWQSQGVDISPPSDSQYANPQVTLVDISQIEPGDLLFVGGTDPGHANPSHVAMYVGNNQVVEASHTGSNVGVSPLKDPGNNAGLNWWGLNPPASKVPGAYFMGVGRVTPTALASAASTKTGGPVSGDASNLTATGLAANGSMIYGNGSWNPGAAQADTNAYIYAGLRLLMNPSDTGVLTIINQITQASQRTFSSAPNGDFIAWFPDYFGQYGYAGVWELNPIELMSTQINWNDSALKTHEFVTGSSATYNASVNPAAGGMAPQYFNDLSSLGIASIDVPGLLQAVLNVTPSDSGLFSDPTAIYEQFGPRSEYQSISYIAANSPVEFWLAVQAFRLSWAQQFSTTINLTFMPELWPGMILRISELGFQAYIHSVTHSWRLGSNGGFETTVNVMAPSATDGSGLIGLGKSGSVG